jgi:hypothetical protein
VTTEKDMVRLIADPRLLGRVGGKIPFLYATAAIVMLRGGSLLEGALEGVLEGTKRR